MKAVVTEEKLFNVRLFDDNGLELLGFIYESGSKHDCIAVRNFLNSLSQTALKIIHQEAQK